jgi:acyl dehydratase
MAGRPVATPPPAWRSVGRSLGGSLGRSVVHRGARSAGRPEQVYGVTGVVPDIDRVARYVSVCGGRLESTLPPLFPHLLGFGMQFALLADPASPFRVAGLVHVANSVEVLRPLPIGAPLDVEVELAGPFPHRRGSTVDLLTRVSLDGAPAWRSTSSYLHREPRPTPVPGPDMSASQGARGVADSAAGRAALARAASGTGWSAASGTGRSAASGTPGGGGAASPAPVRGPLWRLPSDLGRRYAAVSGDRNPIHLSALSARPFGFRRAIAHGMWTAARCLTALEGRLPPTFRMDVEFRSPILLPGTVAFAVDPRRSAVGSGASGRGSLRPMSFRVTTLDGGREHLLGSIGPIGPGGG